MEANNMALREFAEYLANYPTCEGCEGKKDSRFCESCPKGVALAPIAMQARIAVAKPPRNCERFATADDAKREFNYLWNFVWQRGGGCLDERNYEEEFERWLFAYATEQEGESDGN